VITLSKTKDLRKNWRYMKIALDPEKTNYDWCSGHLSPCRIFPSEIYNKNNLLLGILNGRQKEIIKEQKKIFGKFCPGLFLFNPETGNIPWISEKPLFEDPDAKKITFASDFVQTKNSEIIIYCHVNDSFIRAYKLNIEEIKKQIPDL
jgi:hypothetical protein